MPAVPPGLRSPSAGRYPLAGAGVVPEGSLAQRRGGRVQPPCGELKVAGMDTGWRAGVHRDVLCSCLDDTSCDPVP